MTDRTRLLKNALSLGLLTALAACGAAPSQGVARGEAVYDTCAPCHGEDGAGDFEQGAPAIAGLPAWYVAGQLQGFQQSWRSSHPFDTVGLRMKSMSLALDLEGDAESVSEYIATLPTVTAPPTLEGGSAEAGREHYQTCIACHGADGLGIEVVRAPPLVGQHDWYLLRQYQQFRKGWRGTHPQDGFGQTMRPNSLLFDDDQIIDVLAYVQTLQ